MGLRWMRRGRALAALCAVALLGAARPAAHPIHTTLAVVTHLPAERAVTVNVRVFADDLARGVAGHPNPPSRAAEDPTARYVASSFALWNPDGTRVPLRWCGSRPQGGVVWACLRGPMPRGLRGARVLSTLQFALYHDQVNVVQAGTAASRKTMMFVPGDRPKPIP
ncbi:MAG TPA: DUF6702 family protein [Longimicrobium sp.]